MLGSRATTHELFSDVAAHFALGELRTSPQLVTRGAMGEIWRVEAGAGSWAVKCLFDWVEAPSVPTDLAFQAKAAVVGIPLPRPVTTERGDAVVEISGTRVRVYEWVTLCAAPPTRSPSLEREAGRLLALLHLLDVHTDQGVDPWYISTPPPETWQEIVERAERAAAPWASSLAGHQVLLGELRDLAPSTRARASIVCHRDFDRSNVLPTASGTLVVLDWENSGPLAPEYELASFLLSWATSGRQPDVGVVKAILEGYWRAGGSARVIDAGDFVSAISVRVNFLKVMAELALDDEENRRFAEGHLRSLLGGELRGVQAVVTRILAVTSEINP
ncbi:MAG: phosphotransferase [Acidimicrobiales bacterium]